MPRRRKDLALAWANNEDEFEYYVKALIQRRLLAITSADHFASTNPIWPVWITSEGWEYIERIRTDLGLKVQGFVAMSFDDDLYSIHSNGIAPAIAANGYKPYRVDSERHLDRIDAKIIAEIKTSRLLVADVTQQRQGVYYEAGYTQGLGLPVIWCVREDELGNVHFDTRQYSHATTRLSRLEPFSALFRTRCCARICRCVFL